MVTVTHKPLAFKQGEIYNLPSNINNKSTIGNLQAVDIWIVDSCNRLDAEPSGNTNCLL
ncbi:MAG: hypothetical protein KME55_23700 [Nostoc indistinguendum CM1-VF10]|nr:hypothetical protein [Nostoc indistinguendum CM1-VF10]